MRSYGFWRELFFFLPSSSSFYSAFVFNGCNRHRAHRIDEANAWERFLSSFPPFFFCHFSTIQGAFIYSNVFFVVPSPQSLCIGQAYASGAHGDVAEKSWVFFFLFPPKGMWIRCVRPPSLSSGTRFFHASLHCKISSILMNCFAGFFMSPPPAPLQKKERIGCLTGCIMVGCWWDSPPVRMQACFFFAMVSNEGPFLMLSMPDTLSASANFSTSTRFF